MKRSHRAENRKYKSYGHRILHRELCMQMSVCVHVCVSLRVPLVLCRRV